MTTHKTNTGHAGRPGPKGPPYARSRDTADEEPRTVWLYGIHAVEAALANPARKRIRFLASRNAAQHLPEGLGEPEILAPDSIAGMLPPGAVHQGLALLTEPLPDPDLSESTLPIDPARPVVLLDHVTDPQNVGAVLRSAAAFGARAVVTTQRRSPPVTGTLAKAATGAVEHVPYVRVQNLARAMEHLSQAGYRLVGLAEDGGTALPALRTPQPVALALGAEGEGLRALTREKCDDLVRLPTQGPISSLNVSNAAAIALYHLTAMREG